jgi:demethylmenaquinone methyltransferase/2-methoxy-6-polyprenyl-1,4-benzoquinol methylase
MFGSIAPRYDLLNHVLSLNIDKRWRKYTLHKAPPRDGYAVLDVCTGTGDLALAFARFGAKNLRVVGVDFCAEMLDIAKKKQARLGESVTFQEADAQALPFANEEFDIVTCAFGLRNVADTRRGLEELARVARAGGTVAILEFSRPKIAPLRWLYLAYFKHLLPRVGQSLAKNDHAAYEYLPQSVMEFPDGQEMADLMTSVGLTNIRVDPLTFGVATLYLGTKAVVKGE